MDIFSSRKWLMAAVVVLVILNISALISVWLLTSEQRPLPVQNMNNMRNPEVIRDFIRNELGFSKTQMDAFRKSGEKHRMEADRLQDEMMELKEQMADVLFDDVSDEQSLKEMSEAIGRLQAELEQINISHFVEIKALCNSEQKKKLKNLFMEIVKRSRREGLRRDIPRRHPLKGRQKDRLN